MTNGIAHRKSQIANRVLRFSIFDVRCAILLLSCYSLVWAKPAEDIRNELPGPLAAQAVVLQRTITVSWRWEKPEALPVFSTFGFEIKRQDGKTFLTPQTTFVDSNLAPGSYQYSIRARGLAKEKGKPVTYVSDWSEPVGGAITAACSGPPTVELSVEPTQKKFASISSMRFHLHGRAVAPGGCTLGAVTYHLDTGSGIVHMGNLKVDAKGAFDAFVNAFGPEDEIPTGHVSFSMTATAEDEAGPTTSSAYAMDVDLENPFAPHQP